MSDQPDVPMIDPSRGWGGKLSDWLKQHWTTTIIVAIIVFLIWGIYSNYSTEVTENPNENSTANTEDTLNPEDLIAEDNPDLLENIGDTVEVVEDTTTEDTTIEDATVIAAEEETPAVTVTEDTENNIFTVVAIKGEGVTHLSRKALKQYLQNNSDSELTKEHKIFIEDYMRKNTNSETLNIGDSRTFSVSLIEGAINASKNLTENQLNNLKKYSSKVSNL